MIQPQLVPQPRVKDLGAQIADPVDPDDSARRRARKLAEATRRSEDEGDRSGHSEAKEDENGEGLGQSSFPSRGGQTKVPSSEDEDEERRNYLECIKDREWVVQEESKLCSKYRDEVRQGDVLECEVCKKAEEMEKGLGNATRSLEVDHEAAFKPIRELLFADTDEDHSGIQDTGQNWNSRFQEALRLPENTEEEMITKWRRLTTVNRDFVAAAVTYGKTIISEYFLHSKDKSIRPRQLGGVAGGKKFVWRGILFKLADGASGPYHGNDEAAAKGAGHDLRGATHYLGTRTRGLHYALQCLIDFKGFRMTAQSVLPVGPSTLQYGTADAGTTVYNENPELEEKMKQVAEKLNLKSHMVKGKVIHSACDIEGHKGEDGRLYLLDFARAFPPEFPTETYNLTQLLNDGTPVLVSLPGTDPEVTKALASGGARFAGGRSSSQSAPRGESMVEREREDGEEELKRELPEVVKGPTGRFMTDGHENGGVTFVPERVKIRGVIMRVTQVRFSDDRLLEANIRYDVRLESGTVIDVCALDVEDRRLSIYWRMLRPEFVKTGFEAGERVNPEQVRPAPEQEDDVRQADQTAGAPAAQDSGEAEPTTRERKSTWWGAFRLPSVVAEVDEEGESIRKPSTSDRSSIRTSDDHSVLLVGALAGSNAPPAAALLAPAAEGYTGFSQPDLGSDVEAGADTTASVTPSETHQMLDDGESGEAGGDSGLAEAGEWLPGHAPGRPPGPQVMDTSEGDGIRKSLETPSRMEGVSPPGGQGLAIRTKNGAKDRSNLLGGLTLNLGSEVGSRRQRPSDGPDSPRPRPSVSFLPARKLDERGEATERDVWNEPKLGNMGRSVPASGDMFTVNGNERYEVYMENEDENNISMGPSRPVNNVSAGGYHPSYRSFKMLRELVQRASFRIPGSRQDCGSQRSSASNSYVPGFFSTKRFGSFFATSDSSFVGRGQKGETYQPGGGSSGRAGPMGIIVDHDAYDSQGSLHFFPKDGETRADSYLRSGGGRRECSRYGSYRQSSTRPDKLREMIMLGNMRKRKNWFTLEEPRSSRGRGVQWSRQWGSLSPDALSGFSKQDPEAYKRNTEVRAATKTLIRDLIPFVAAKFAGLGDDMLEKLDLSCELHKVGVNMRHLGLVRDFVQEDKTLLRDMLLSEIVARTLKNILRSFQRKWMKAERSTSEQGMLNLVVQFLNLVTGAHDNSEEFWEKEVLFGIMQRFGVSSLSEWERENIWRVCSNPRILKPCVFKLTEMQGLVLSTAAREQLEEDTDPRKFKFVLSDIQEIRPIVRAEKLRTLQDNMSRRVYERLIRDAMRCFLDAHHSLPSDPNTQWNLVSYSDSCREVTSSDDEGLPPPGVRRDFVTLSDNPRKTVGGLEDFAAPAPPEDAPILLLYPPEPPGEGRTMCHGVLPSSVLAWFKECVRRNACRPRHQKIFQSPEEREYPIRMGHHFHHPGGNGCVGPMPPHHPGSFRSQDRPVEPGVSGLGPMPAGNPGSFRIDDESDKPGDDYLGPIPPGHPWSFKTSGSHA